jgi:hypothetical protein
VVVFNLTRFARDKYDHFALRSLLQSLGISLRSATEPIDDTSTGKLMEGVLAAFAQFDNDCRSDRTRAGMKAALELGRWTFLAPIGYLNATRAMVGATRGDELTGGPVPKVVAAMVLHAVHKDIRIRPVSKVPLNRFVGAVGVTDEDLKTLLDHRVETPLSPRREAGKSVVNQRQKRLMQA